MKRFWSFREYSKMIFLLLLTAGVLLQAACGSDSSDNPSDINNPTGNTFLDPITPSSNGLPFGKRPYTYLKKIYEFWGIGINNSKSDNQWLYDIDTDNKTVTIVNSLKNTSFDPGKKKSAKSGNFNNDLYDETAIITWDPVESTKGTLYIIGKDGAPVDTNVDLTVVTGKKLVDYDLCVADIDDDGYDEIIVVGSVLSIDAAADNARLWIIDDSVNKKEPQVQSIQGNSNKGVKKIKVAAGAIASDKKMKIAVAWYGSEVFSSGIPFAGKTDSIFYSIYNASDLKFELSNEVDDMMKSTLTGFIPSVSLSMTDIDGDKDKEIIIIGLNSGSNTSGVFMYFTQAICDDFKYDAQNNLSCANTYQNLLTQADTVWWRTSLLDTPENFIVPIDYNPEIDLEKDASGNFTGNKIEELLIGPYLYSFDKVNKKLIKLVIPDTLFFNPNDYNGKVADIKSVDFDGDYDNEIVVLFKDGSLKVLKSVYDKESKEYSWTCPYKFDGSGNTLCNNAILVPVNVDEDSIVVEYTGNKNVKSADDSSHTTAYKDIKILAVLTAPPAKNGIEQNNSNSSTSLGTGESTNYKVGTTASIRAGVIIGTEIALSAGLIANVEAARVELEFEHQIEASGSYNISKTETFTITDTAGADDDQIIFTAVPYDIYKYKVSSHYDASLVGTTITVETPQTPKKYSRTRTYYNDNVDGVKITKSILQNTPYDVSSYPKSAEEVIARTNVDVGNNISLSSSYKILGLLSPTGVAGGSSSSSSKEIVKSSGYDWSTGLTLSTDMSAKLILGGLKVGGSAGFSIGSFYESSFEQSLSFSGSVGGIKDSYLDSNSYDWGLLAYKQTLKDENDKVMQDFIVVNYIVTNIK